MNDIALKKICFVIAMTYAIDKDIVWEIYLKNGSIDKTIEIVQNIQN